MESLLLCRQAALANLEKLLVQAAPAGWLSGSDKQFNSASPS
jgi:hypothetical protein